MSLIDMSSKTESMLDASIETLAHLQDQETELKKTIAEVKAKALELMEAEQLVKYVSKSGKVLNVIRSTDSVIDPEGFSKLLPLEQFLKCVKVSVSAARRYVGEIALAPITTETQKSPYVTLKAGNKK